MNKNDFGVTRDCAFVPGCRCKGLPVVKSLNRHHNNIVQLLINRRLSGLFIAPEYPPPPPHTHTEIER